MACSPTAPTSAAALQLTLVVDEYADGATAPLLHDLLAALGRLGKGDLAFGGIKLAAVDGIGRSGVEETGRDAAAAVGRDGEEAVDAERRGEWCGAEVSAESHVT